MNIRLHSIILHRSLPQILIGHSILKSHHLILRRHLIIHDRSALEHALVLVLAQSRLILNAKSAKTWCNMLTLHALECVEHIA